MQTLKHKSLARRLGGGIKKTIMQLRESMARRRRMGRAQKEARLARKRQKKRLKGQIIIPPYDAYTGVTFTPKPTDPHADIDHARG